MEGTSNGVTLQSYVWQIAYIAPVTYVGISIRYSSGKVNSSGVQKASIGTCPSLPSTLSCGLVRCLI